MKKTTISVSFEDEKLSALKMYLEQRGQTVEGELEKALDTLYAKTVPAGVREFLDLRSGVVPTPPKAKKPKPPTASAESNSDENKGADQ
ncbi:MAG: hypothetical protein J6D11_07790 [Clostridia bacterium]|nr:hypothetical protein [Clostridia bacterium]